jgi:CsoR family transcriptional regulator, copper-sensing transcriptional repressor
MNTIEGEITQTTDQITAMNELAVDILRRLSRVEGQVRGVARMVETRRQCDDILAQIIAARNALDRVAVQVVAGHVEQCIATLPPAEAAHRIARAVELLSRVG